MQKLRKTLSFSILILSCAVMPLRAENTVSWDVYGNFDEGIMVLAKRNASASEDIIRGFFILNPRKLITVLDIADVERFQSEEEKDLDILKITLKDETVRETGVAPVVLVFLSKPDLSSLMMLGSLSKPTPSIVEVAHPELIDNLTAREIYVLVNSPRSESHFRYVGQIWNRFQPDDQVSLSQLDESDASLVLFAAQQRQTYIALTRFMGKNGQNLSPKQCEQLLKVASGDLKQSKP